MENGLMTWGAQVNPGPHGSMGPEVSQDPLELGFYGIGGAHLGSRRVDSGTTMVFRCF